MQFDFGKNWQEFSKHVLTQNKVDQAIDHFKNLVQGMDLKDQTFIDIGFGQGLSLLIAASLGAKVSGLDINPKCYDVLLENQRFFPNNIPLNKAHIYVGSVLDSGRLHPLQRDVEGGLGFNIVHSWGVLHHTGDMKQSIDHAIQLVAPKGFLILALYNRHWSSGLWKMIKYIYVHSPSFLQKVYIYLFYPIIYIAKWLITGKDPLKQERGMDFFYNVIDWVGGYPYEYASKSEVERMILPKGFTLRKFVPATVPTGCNEFIFQKL